MGLLPTTHASGVGCHLDSTAGGVRPSTSHFLLFAGKHAGVLRLDRKNLQLYPCYPTARWGHRASCGWLHWAWRLLYSQETPIVLQWRLTHSILTQTSCCLRSGGGGSVWCWGCGCWRRWYWRKATLATSCPSWPWDMSHNHFRLSGMSSMTNTLLWYGKSIRATSNILG